MNNLTIDTRIKPLLPANYRDYELVSSRQVGAKNLWLEAFQLPDSTMTPILTVARSYKTVIAVLQCGRWVVTSAKYSPTTSRHCNMLCKEWSTRV